MQLSTLLLAITATLAPLAASEACVAGGPADQVAAANTCCTELGSTWYGSHANQGICVLPDWATFWYKLCVVEIPNSAGLLDSRCIPGEGGSLTVGSAPTSTTWDQTITSSPKA